MTLQGNVTAGDTLMDAVTSWFESLRDYLPNFALAGLSVEFTMLGLAVVLGLLQLLIAARTGNSQRGLAWNVGARDKEPPPVGVIAGRLDRAFRNFMETFPFFAVAVLATHATDRFGWMTLVGTQLYLVARVVYVPLYATGVPVFRTVIWLISIVGLVLTLAALFVEPATVIIAPGDST
jgi:uncharacterized MAPEG superfamily protein